VEIAKIHFITFPDTWPFSQWDLPCKCIEIYRILSKIIVLGDTENFFHDIYHEKVSRYWVYHNTYFASGITGGGGKREWGQLWEQLPPGAVQQARGTKNLTKIF